MVRRARRSQDKGFTIIELLVVLGIIGVLAAIAIPVFLNHRKKAVDGSVKSDLGSAALELEMKTNGNANWTVPPNTPIDTVLGEDFKESPGTTLTVTGEAFSWVITGYNPKATKAYSRATALTFDSKTKVIK